jgi:hypothetical protein
MKRRQKKIISSVRRIAQAYSQTPWRKQVQVIGLFLLGLLFAMLASSLYLNLNARAATYGREILIMQEDIEQTELINADLKTQLGVLTSPAILENRALELGFERVQKDEPLYIVVPGYVDRQEITVAPPPTPVEKITITLPPNFTESLVDWFRNRLSFLLNPVLEAQP